jgi:hypothetical protein
VVVVAVDVVVGVVVVVHVFYHRLLVRPQYSL